MSLSCSTVLTLVAGFARPTAPGTRPLLYVDPVDEDLTREAISRGVPLLPVWSAPSRRVPRSAQRVPDKALQQLGSIPVAPKNGEEVAWASSRLPAGTCLGGVLCGSEAGLSTAERMQAALVPERSNGVCPARRDKLLMNRALAGHGLLTAATASPSDWPAAEAFIRSLRGNRVVLKPRRGTGGCGVALACDEAHARRAFEALQAPFSPDDEVAAAPLLQEYLAGEEWVVDTASRDGEHKAVALWRYSKGPANGAPFVYRYDELMPAAGETEARLVEYALGALEAVGWRWGPCHIELKQTSRGPALVEVNAGRCNGVSFASLTGPCIGYTQYDAAFASLADDDTAWRALPPLPPPSLRSSARLVKLVATRAGRLRRGRGSDAEHTATRLQ
uniref:ATP-grasp domain-containing protein n=1 Tax=Emiliania huxleyi TaxID=2903 RepID=A0A7S3WDU2_EMIHU